MCVFLHHLSITYIDLMKYSCSTRRGFDWSSFTSMEVEFCFQMHPMHNVPRSGYSSRIFTTLVYVGRSSSFSSIKAKFSCCPKSIQFMGLLCKSLWWWQNSHEHSKSFNFDDWVLIWSRKKLGACFVCQCIVLVEKDITYVGLEPVPFD